MNLISNDRYNALLKDAIVLPESQKLDEKTTDAIKSAIAKAEDTQKEYEPTKKQLEENPWLKNAVNGLRKVSDIIENYNNGIDGSGEFSMINLSYDSFQIFDKDEKMTHAYTVYAEATQTTTHLAYDDENYTREGKSNTSAISFHTSYLSYEVNEFKDIHLDLDVKDTDKIVNFDKLYEKLKNDKNFEKEFISSLEDHLYENDSSKLIDQIKKALEVEDATLTIKDPMSLSTYAKNAHLVPYSKFSTNVDIHV